MGFTTDDLERIERAIAQGALSVRYEDRTVTYDSFRELVARRDFIRGQLGLKPAGPRRILAQYSDGTQKGGSEL